MKIDDVKTKNYNQFQQRLDNLCKKLGLEEDYDIDDIFFAAREVCEWRCAFSGKRTAGLNLCVWDHSKPVSGKNLLLVSSKYLKDWEDKPLKDLELTEDERKRALSLLELAEKSYSGKTIFMTNKENNN